MKHVFDGSDPTAPPFVINAPGLEWFHQGVETWTPVAPPPPPPPPTLEVTVRGTRFVISEGQPRDENGKCRTELRLLDPESNKKMFLVDKDGSEMWSAVEFLLPTAEWDTSFPNKVLLTQWHHPSAKGFEGKMPPLQVFMWRKNLYIRECHGTYVDLYKYPPPMDTWNRLVTQVRWDFRGKGLLKIWLNGKLIVSYSGKMGYKEAPGAYASVGLYCPEPAKGLDHACVYGLWERSTEAIAP